MIKIDKKTGITNIIIQITHRKKNDKKMRKVYAMSNDILMII